MNADFQPSTTLHNVSAHHIAQSDHFSSREHAWLKFKDLCAKNILSSTRHVSFACCLTIHIYGGVAVHVRLVPGPKGPRRIVCQKHAHIHASCFHFAPHSTLNTSTSSLSPTSLVLLSSSSTNSDLLSTHLFIHCEDPRQDGTSTEFQSSTVYEPKRIEPNRILVNPQNQIIDDQDDIGRPSTVSSLLSVEIPQNSVVGQQRQQISELQFDKFPNPSTFLCWKIRFKSQMTTCSDFFRRLCYGSKKKRWSTHWMN